MATSSTPTSTSSSPSSNSTAPSTSPSTASSIVNVTRPSQGCTSSFCPIDHSHDHGLYLHSYCANLSTEARRIFAPSVPPPDVLVAYERCIRNDGTRTDADIWMAFHELHVEPLLEHTDAVWVVPVPRRSHDDDPMVGEDADPGGIDIYSTIEDCRHPFGLLNPPEKVWEAHRRLILGAAGPQDQELVDEFAVRNAYYGSGLGKRKDMSRRFVVRRSRYVGHLARERRIKKEIQSKRSEYQ